MSVFTRLALFALLIMPLTMASMVSQAEEAASSDEVVETTQAAEPAGKSFGHRVLFYLPNRVCDVFDLVRLRVRFGPGVDVNARVTKYGEVHAGAYTSFFVGLHGPRTEPRIPWPVGIESRAGAGISVVDVSTSTGAPTYGYGEVGAGFQAGIIGLDLGADPIEALDLVLGFLFIDLTGDDF
ncbi:MAG: hypothetical protein JRC77_05300 [Deltaproteobacteria bacterium]|nr:hypothetical protein [Deltaproteobacteria bacterium]